MCWAISDQLAQVVPNIESRGNRDRNQQRRIEVKVGGGGTSRSRLVNGTHEPDSCLQFPVTQVSACFVRRFAFVVPISRMYLEDVAQSRLHTKLVAC
jgi:hypothetical protein